MSKVRMSKCDKVLAYIRQHGYITDNDAHDVLHINRLSGRIYDLKSRGIDVRMEWRTGKNIDGQKVRYGAYYLGDSEK